jgi:Protein of unknown function (DUF2924)
VETTTKTGANGLSLAAQIAQLRQLKVRQLRARYREVFGQETATAHKQHLVRRIAWRLQALAEGDISDRARKRAMAISLDADLRVTVPAEVIEIAGRRDMPRLPARPSADSSSESRPQLVPGARLTRVYQGRKVTATVLEDGFEFEGERYTSLSAVARAATGTRWNGLLFFGLVERGKAPSVR